MKKRAKLFSIITSTALLTSSVTAINSNAALLIIEGEEKYEEYVSGYTEFNDYGVFEWVSEVVPLGSYRCFYEEGTNNIRLIDDSWHILTFYVPAENDNEEIIASFISDIDSEMTYRKYDDSLEWSNCYRYAVYLECITEETYEKSNILCAKLNEQKLINEFKYWGDVYSVREFGYPTDKLYFEAENFDEAAISQHLDSYDIAYEINTITEAEIPFSYYTSDETAYTITLSDESTWQDYVYVKSLINEKFDVGIDYAVPCSSSTIGTEIDILSQINSSYGDLNNNGSIDMSDAVALMANVSNPEEYPLTDLQLLLADVYQQGDGVGINDAVAVQKYLTKQIDSLPESTL